MTIGVKTQRADKSDPKASALAKKLKELTRQSQTHFEGEHASHVKVTRKNQPPGDHCSCSCGCC